VLVDFEGYQAIERIKCLYNNKIVNEVTGEEMVDWIKRYYEDKKRSDMAQFSGGYMSVASRYTRGASAATNSINLALLLQNEDMNRMICQIGLPNKIRFEVTFHPLSKLGISTDATTFTCSITDVRLKIKYWHLKLDEQNQKFNDVHSPSGELTKITTIESHLREPIASAVTSFSLKLRNIKNDVYQLVVWLRTQAAVDNASGRDLEAWQFPNRAYLRDNGTAITNNVIPTTYGTYRELNEAHPNGEYGRKCIVFNFAHNKLIEASNKDCFGSRCFANYNNPELVLEWDSATGDAYYCDVRGYIHNVRIEKQGDFRKYLA